MTSEQRTRASNDMTLTYLHSYYSDWRLVKVLTIEKLLANRYEFYNEVVATTHNTKSDLERDATIAQEIQNGLYFDAISQCVQYIEDLFALIQASQQPDFFIKNLVTYDAGKVTNLIKSYHASLSDERLAQTFHFPLKFSFPSPKDTEQFEKQITLLSDIFRETIKFHRDYEFFHNQYKHGLAVAMRPLGNIYSQEQIDLDKKGEMIPIITVYDNWGLSIAEKKGRGLNQGVFMPGFSKNVSSVIGDLIKENNFIRLIHPPDIDINIASLIEIAYKTRACINTFIANYAETRIVDSIESHFQLPLDYRKNTIITVKYEK